MKTKFIKLAFLIFTFSIFNFNFASAQMFWNKACQITNTSNNYIAVPNSATINITGSFTIEAWINPSSIGIGGILSKGGTFGSAVEYGMSYSGGSIYLWTNGIIRVQSMTPSVFPNRWTHVAGTYNTASNEFRIYINGIQSAGVQTTGAAPPSNSDSLFIGIRGSGTSFAGQIDEVRLWNRALSATEVSQYFRTTLGVKTGIYTGLVMSLPFQRHDALQAFSLFDITSNGNVGFNRGVTGADQTNQPYHTIMPNESVELDGNEDYLAARDGNEINPAMMITLEAWVYPRSLNPFTIISKGTDYRLGYDGFRVFYVINNFFNPTVSLPLNQWSHVAFSYSFTGAITFYLNGNLVLAENFPLGFINNGTDSLYIGGGPGGLPDLNGFIDEVRITHDIKSSTTINRFLYRSIDESNEPDPPVTKVIYNLDGYGGNNAGGGGTLFFRNNARFSHPGTISRQPVSPLERNDNSNFSNGYYIKTSNSKIPLSGTAGTTTDSTFVNLNSTVSDVNFFVALNHTNSANLDIVLVAPNGDSVIVFNNKSTKSLDENLITVFDDQADSALIDNRYSSFLPKIKPENNMNSIFNGDNSQGKWKIIVRDEQANDTGFLYAWGIQLNNLSQRPKDLDISALIQGFYDAATNLMVPDTMRVYVRNGTSPFAIVDSSNAVLSNLGLGLFTLANVTNDQQYYVQLKHRNSIETWSNPFAFVKDEASYSFFNAAGSAFGNNQIQVDNSPVRFAIYGGDVNQDLTVDVIDVGAVYNDAINSVSGYVITDLNGDEFVDVFDIGIAYNNSQNSVSAITPL